MARQLHRYLSAADFCRDLKDLHVFSEYLGDALLESLEQQTLIIARRRLRLPDPIARRLWFENHSDLVHAMAGELERDGPDWTSACELLRALDQWGNVSRYGAASHPFEDAADRFHPFVAEPDKSSFQPWSEFRVDVSNDEYSTLFDNTYCRSYYSSWQLLLAAEVASSGIVLRLNLADEETRRMAMSALDEGRLPATRYYNPAEPSPRNQELCSTRTRT